MAYFLAWCFGDSSLAAFTIPCALNGWDRAEKASSIRRAAIYYVVIGLACLIKGIIGQYKSEAANEPSRASLRYGIAEERSSYAPLVSRVKRVLSRKSSDEERDPLIAPATYGGTDVEMRRILPK